MANIPISSLPNVQPSGYTPNDLLVLVNYQLPSGTTSNTPLSAITSYVLSSFTGNTSATCISDLYVTNVYGCSPITVNNDLILNYSVSAGTNSDDILVRENTGYIKSIPVSGLPFSNVTGLTFNNGNFDLTVGSDNGSAFTQSLSILATDMTVTGGTYNSGTGVATFTTNSGNTFNVSGFLTGYTDTNIYTVDGSLTGNRVVDLNGYSLTFNDDIIVNTVYVGKGAGAPSANIAIGNSSTFSSNTFGTNNIAIGNNSLSGNITGYFNTSVGHLSLAANDGGYNTAIGYSTLGANTSGQFNTSLGANSSITNTIGNSNTSVGSQSLSSNFDGSNNSVLGVLSLYSNDSGSNNTSIGYYSGFDILNGNYNTFVGSDTGGGIVNGSYNTIIGANVIGLSSSLSNNIIIADGQGNRRINVDNTGNVGIGTTTPSYKLSVSGITNTTSLIVGTELGTYVQSGNHKMQIVSTGTTTPLMIQGGSGVVEMWKDTTPTVASSFGMGVPGSGLTNDFIFSTYSGSWSEKLRLTNSGNFGIGVLSPSEKLEVSGKTKTTNFQMTSGATNGYVLTSDASGNASWQTTSGLSEYTLTFIGGSLSPTDSATYYIGPSATAPFTTDTNVQHIALKTGILTKVSITSRQSAGSSENSTFSVGINGVYTQISNTIKFNGVPRNNSLITGLNIPVVQGDLLTIRWVCPVWATNPTGVITNITLFIQ